VKQPKATREQQAAQYLIASLQVWAVEGNLPRTEAYEAALAYVQAQQQRAS
jgi:hypothetical protein